MNSGSERGERGPLPAFRRRLQAGNLVSDPAQARAAERLQELWLRLQGYDPPPQHGRESLLARFFRRKKIEEAEDYPGGLYLVGEVGRGKSMLMDLFFAEADLPRKRRIHFHRFMQDAHTRLHMLKRERPGMDDPIPPLADDIAAQAALLCFDEFQVNDIADAMILGRLFQALFDRGVVIVATSNTGPDDLFAGQPGRDAFLPFIAILKQNVDVLVLDGGRDYRRARLHGMRTWYVLEDEQAQQALNHAFRQLAGTEAAPARLCVSGRDLLIPQAANGVARSSFGALCMQALGPGDYLAIATHFHALILEDIPILTPDRRNEARRFITLIDALYDHRVKLIASAAAEPDQLYEQGDGAEAFRRTASRLEEMRSQDYLDQPHLT